MSEYQYYEFVAIDGPISDEGLRYARGCSRRAEVSRVRWQNTYNYGDFHGSVDTLLKHYDAHFYIANWGSVLLGLAFPKNVITREAIRPYLRPGKQWETTLSVKETGDRCIVYWERHEEETCWGTEGEGIIDQFIGIRDELMRGDYRALFLGWLADFYVEERQTPKESAAFLPPIPAGLGQLSPALKTLIKHFPVDPDALAVAAGLAPAGTQEPIPMASVLEKLSVEHMRAMPARVAEGGGTGVMAELIRMTYPQQATPAGETIRNVDFTAKVIEHAKARRRRETEAAQAKQRLKEEQRRQHLASVLERADAGWAKIDSLVAQQKASAYDQVAEQLEELRDAYAQGGDTEGFHQKLDALRLRYSNRPAVLRRITHL